MDYKQTIALDNEKDTNNGYNDRTVSIIGTPQHVQQPPVKIENSDWRVAAEQIAVEKRLEAGRYSRSGTSDEPILAWLVSVEGNRKGADYPVTSYSTKVGGGQNLYFGEGTNPDTAFILTYIKNDNEFVISREKVGGICLVNDIPLINATKLKSFDEIKIDGHTLIFVAFCEGSRKWD